MTAQLGSYVRSAKKAKKSNLNVLGLSAVHLSICKGEQEKVVLEQTDKQGHVRVDQVSSDLKTLSRAIWQQNNVHSSGVKNTGLADNGKHIVTCSDTEAALWSLKQDQPVMLLDEPCQGAHNSL